MTPIAWQSMLVIEIMRLGLGLLIAAFHRQIADFVMPHERQLVALFRSRGVPLPDVVKESTAYTLYFSLGIAVALIELVRIYLMFHR
jgi:hypothetical protein